MDITIISETWDDHTLELNIIDLVEMAVAKPSGTAVELFVGNSGTLGKAALYYELFSYRKRNALCKIELLLLRDTAKDTRSNISFTKVLLW